MNHLSDLISVVKRGAARGPDYNRPARQNRGRVRPNRRDASSAAPGVLRRAGLKRLPRKKFNQEGRVTLDFFGAYILYSG